MNLVSNSGIILNLSVIIVTLKSKSLRGTANFLLALISFYEILHQMGHLLLLFVVISGINFIEFLTAMRILMPTIFGMNASLFGITAAAADRLFAILAQKRHKQINKKVYLGIHLIFTILYGLYCVYGFYSSALEHPFPPIIGSIADIIAVPFVQFWSKMTFFLNLLAIFFYLLIWMAVKKENAVTHNTSSHLLKSLILILIFNVGGYLANLSLLYLFDQLICNSCLTDTLIGWQLSFINQILMNLAVAINAPILYFTSTEYRRAYQKFILSSFFKKYKNETTISKLPNIVGNGNAIGGIMRNNLISNE